MRVYQFRHIRAGWAFYRQPIRRSRRPTPHAHRSPLAVLTAAVALALLGARPVVSAPYTRARRRPRWSSRSTTPPLAYAAQTARSSHAIDLGAAPVRRGARRVVVPAAEARWRYRVVANGVRGRRATPPVAALRALPGVRDVSPARRTGAALDRSPGQIGAPALWGRRPADGGHGHEDRDHRRRRRPASPVLRPGGLHDAARLPEGPDRLHDGEGDRRARLPATRSDAGSTPRKPFDPSSRATGPTWPVSPPATTARSPRTASGSRASRRERSSATTRR